MEIVKVKKFQSRDFTYEEIILSPVIEKRLEQMHELSLRYNLHSITVKDCIERDQSIKIKYYDDYKFVVWYYFHPSLQIPLEVHFLLGGNFLILIADTLPSNLVDSWKMLCFPDGQNIILNNALYQMFKVFAKNTEIYIEALDYEIALLEEKIVTQSCNPKKILEMKYLVYEIEKTMRAANITIESIYEQSELTADQKIYLTDIKDSYKRMNENTGYLHLASMSLFNMYYGSNAAYSNKIMKRLTLFSIYFLPISALSCLFSMNFELIPYKHLWFQIFGLSIVLGFPLLIFIYFSIIKIDNIKKYKKLLKNEEQIIKVHPFMSRKFISHSHFSKHKNQK